MSKNFYPLIGFSSGDPNGIGLEVLLKSLSDNAVLSLETKNIRLASLETGNLN